MWLWCYVSHKTFAGSSLVVQWLGLHASTAGGPGSIPGQGTKIPQCRTVRPKKPQKNKTNKQTKTLLQMCVTGRFTLRIVSGFFETCLQLG